MALLLQLKTKQKQSKTPKLTLSFQAVREGAAELLNMVHCLPHSGQHSRLASRCPVTSRSVAQTKFYSPRPELERTARFYKQTGLSLRSANAGEKKLSLCSLCEKSGPLENKWKTNWLTLQRNSMRRAEEQRY